jgi:hypothetical protein
MNKANRRPPLGQAFQSWQVPIERSIPTEGVLHHVAHHLCNRDQSRLHALHDVVPFEGIHLAVGIFGRALQRPSQLPQIISKIARANNMPVRRPTLVVCLPYALPFTPLSAARFSRDRILIAC